MIVLNKKNKFSRAATCTITFDANGGVGAPDPVSRDMDSWILIPNERPTKTGSTFEGWSDSVNGQAEYQPYTWFWGDKESVTLYAVWHQDTVQTYQIEYDANGGYPTPKSQTKQHDVPIQITNEKPQVYDGRIFAGWSTKRVGDVEYNSGDWYRDNADIYLYALYKEETKPICTLSFDATGGTGAPSNITGDLNSSVYIPYTKPQKNGYKFLGWSTARDNTPEYQIILSSTSITLYAAWKSESTSPVQSNVYIGTNLISEIYIGNTKVNAVYIGNQKLK